MNICQSNIAVISLPAESALSIQLMALVRFRLAERGVDELLEPSAPVSTMSRCLNWF